MLSTLVLLILCQLAVAARFPMFTIRGNLTCRGNPIHGNIIMVDDNFAFTDHLLTEQKVGHDGKFRLRGEPVDDCLDVLLIVEHRCHEMRSGFDGSKKLKAYTEFRVELTDLIKSDYKLNMDIELYNSRVRISAPMLPAYRTFLFGKRMMTDLFDRIKALRFWKNV